MFLVDSHCHLNLISDKANLDKVIQRAINHDVRYMLNVCMTLEEIPETLHIAERYSQVSAAIGLHPNQQPHQTVFDTLLTNAQHQKVIAIGETGLDYFDENTKIVQQQECFRIHIEVAKQLKKPLIIHTRAAKKDTLCIMKETHAVEIGGVMQCFNEDWEMAKKAMDMNFYISFAGLTTFKEMESLRSIVKLIPLDKILIETDSPFFVPHPYQYKQNEPAFLRYIAKYIAKLRGLSLEKFAEMTTQNFFRLFKDAVQPNIHS